MSGSSFSDLEAIGTTPTVLSLESATVPEITALLTTHKPDAVIWSAGAGGKGGKERTIAVDYEGAVKVFEGMETANIRRLIHVGAVDVRSRDKGIPEYYTEDSGELYLIRMEIRANKGSQDERKDVGSYTRL
jgi:nucleoside-diphosphate-sugar epimerase